MKNAVNAMMQSILSLLHILGHSLKWILPSWALYIISLKFCSHTFWAFILFSLLSAMSSVWLFCGFFQECPTRRQDYHDNQSVRVEALVLFIVIAAALAAIVSYFLGSRHDYGEYEKQWITIISGSNPWIGTSNAYGPVHNLFAYAARFGLLLPKAFFGLALVLVGAISSFLPVASKKIDKSTLDQRLKLFVYLACSPFALITVLTFGNNDILPASAMTLSLLLIARFHNFISRFAAGVILAIGAMIKFYPIVILPTIIFRRRILDWPFVAGFLATLSMILVAAYRLWGKSIIAPLLFAGSRESKHLSIFSFFRNVLGYDLDHLSIAAVVAAFAATFFICAVLRADFLLSSIVVFAAVLSFYKVGHQQFFLFFFLVAPYAVRHLLYISGIDFSSELLGALCTWLGFLNWYQLEYALSCMMKEGSSLIFRHAGSLVYLPLSGILFYFFVRQLMLSSGTPKQIDFG